jgi:hypothetical protein
MPESAQCGEKNDEQRGRAAHLPEEAFTFDCVDNAIEVHTVVASEEG